MNRREFLKNVIAGGSPLLAAGCAASPALRLDTGLATDLGRLPYHGLVDSLPEEHDYEARIEGRIPEGLRGSLYRNGPGLFERAGRRKRSILDGDGMIQHFRFHSGGVHYRNRFVRTDKYLSEEAAGRFIHPSWSTQAPGGWPANFWVTGDIRGQAGITVFLVNGRLYAFDESSYPYELDPVTLKTVGETSLGFPRRETIFSAHSKIDPRREEWLNFGVRYGAQPELHISILGTDGRPRYHRNLPLPRFVYIHDWFVSSNYLIALLHPLEIDFWPAQLGLRSISDSLRWRPQEGNLLLIIPRDPGGTPITLEAPACYMWHSLNAWDDGNSICADFVGYSNPDHLVGKDPFISAVMQGRPGEHACPGLLRRYRIDLPKRRVTTEILAEGNFEWPRMDERLRCRQQLQAWLAETRPGEFFWSRILRFDERSGVVASYAFEERVYCSEPVFVPRPGSDHEQGWILSECYDGATGRSFLAVLDALRLGDGPLARVHLEHHVPYSYHGFWQGEVPA